MCTLGDERIVSSSGEVVINTYKGVNELSAIAAFLFCKEIPTITIYGFSFQNLKCLLISPE